MLIDRRVFVAGAAMAAVMPIPKLPAQPSPPTVATMGSAAFFIDGWSKPVNETIVDQVWIRIGPGWRTSWR
jgi:hypothetical protein